MTTYRLFPSTNGPGSPISYSGNFLAGVVFEVTQGGMWFQGYWWWVPSGGDTGAQKFALWNVTGGGTGTLVTAATVTSGTLTAGNWNFVALSVPIQLSIGTQYCACTGWSAVHGFPDSDTAGAGTGAVDSYGPGGHTAGITNGPLFAWSDNTIGASAPPPYGNQGVFSVAGTDPAVTMPASQSNSGNFWIDLQVSDTPPVGYSGSYRLYPNKVDTNIATIPDLNVDYVVATEFTLSQSCMLNKIWYYSPAGTAQLATSADIWQIQGPNAGTIVAGTDSPSWSGAAASGWVSTSFSGVTLPPGSYKVSVFNNAATPDEWSAKDASTNYWDTGVGAAGITSGPLTAPGLSTAHLAYEFNNNAGGNPPFSNGITERGQCTFAQSGTNIYPYLYVDGLAQNYWLDVEVTPVSAPSPQVVASMSSM